MKIDTSFNSNLMSTWKADDGVNFSIALAELTNWLLHVNWLTPDEDAPLELMKPLRIHVEDDLNHVYDFECGKKKIESFHQYYVQPIAMKRYPNLINHCGVLTRFYDPAVVFDLPLRIKPERKKVDVCKQRILENKKFFDIVPKRLNNIPAHIAGNYAFGKCVLFAKAMEMETGLKTAAIIDTTYRTVTPSLHAVVLHDDTTVEDVWGTQPIQNIVDRYGFQQYEINHSYVNSLIDSTILKNPVEYERQLNEAIQVIRQYR